ncbi:hypothetical protein [Helicobacter sp. L8]|uniref:hypothetical protein n=1 Tax=Helicobacter sp. L8 TaxID=2316078 RepID=UPI0013CE09CE|nr:hypothetical protein [Helicobacter sp. L8]
MQIVCNMAVLLCKYPSGVLAALMRYKLLFICSKVLLLRFSLVWLCEGITMNPL